ncbi:two component transcriptional regulator, LuxR family [Prosthecobacter debontii]|uniref:Two component transcriptional regulator, LuxR family n=1 Tax=Prosthecobacter debontii TaxID=48467 RepID=A0A1T4XZ46_9BACT|nr:response regulator transcription factor [Prosthecobacter debontii]SKA94341.1 two component transcriptional regulator, LuxR family [Prosthecobacter debontii]
MKRILIVDDHQLMREAYKHAIMTLGSFEFGEAGTYQEAHDLVTASRWDIVILDVTIPGRNGLDVLAEIRNLPHAPAVLVCSGHDESVYGVRAFKAGAAGYVCKTAGTGEFLKAVREIVQGNNYISTNLAQNLAAFVRSDFQEQPHTTLSEREFQVLRKLINGDALKEIAAELNLSSKTVSTYRSRLMEKLKVKSLPELVQYCIEHGLMEKTGANVAA